jgi:hypothetical protein
MVRCVKARNPLIYLTGKRMVKVRVQFHLYHDTACWGAAAWVYTYQCFFPCRLVGPQASLREDNLKAAQAHKARLEAFQHKEAEIKVRDNTLILQCTHTSVHSP